MATILSTGKGGISVNLSTGSVIAFKSTRFDIAGNLGAKEAYLDVSNKNNDIIFRMTIRRGQSRVFFNDHAAQSLIEGWGQEKSVDLNPVDVERWRRSGVTISVHTCSTYFGERYQILFDLITVFHFDSRFPGPAINIKYSTAATWFRPPLSDQLEVRFYQLNTLPLAERQAIKSGTVPAPGSAISIQTTHFIPNKSCAVVTSGDGKEIRSYQVGPGNILHEYIYSTEVGDKWKHGNLHKLKIILNPTSRIAPVRLHDGTIFVHYQGQFYDSPSDAVPHNNYMKLDPKTDFIQKAYGLHFGDDPKKRWEVSPPITRAVAGSSIAAVILCDANGRHGTHIYYQDPELYLREHYFDRSLDQWLLGEFNPGLQPKGTPITAEVVHGGDVDINVIWRDARGRAVTSSWSKSSGWDPDTPNPDGRDEPLEDVIAKV